MTDAQSVVEPEVAQGAPQGGDSDFAQMIAEATENADMTEAFALRQEEEQPETPPEGEAEEEPEAPPEPEPAATVKIGEEELEIGVVEGLVAQARELQAAMGEEFPLSVTDTVQAAKTWQNIIDQFEEGQEGAMSVVGVVAAQYLAQHGKDNGVKASDLEIALIDPDQLDFPGQVCYAACRQMAKEIIRLQETSAQAIKTAEKAVSDAKAEVSQQGEHDKAAAEATLLEKKYGVKVTSADVIEWKRLHKTADAESAYKLEHFDKVADAARSGATAKTTPMPRGVAAPGGAPVSPDGLDVDQLTRLMDQNADIEGFTKRTGPDGKVHYERKR